MAEMLARCQSCGYEQAEEFAHCPVCMGASAWWCDSCRIWCSSRRCPSCGGAVIVPPEIILGSFPVGSRVPVQFTVRNPSRKPIEFGISTDDPSLSLLTRRLVIRPGEEATVIGAVAIGTVRPGKRSYRVRFETTIATETRLVLEVIPAIVRLEFVPPELVIRNAVPGKTIRQQLTINNTGNIAIAAAIATSESWLGSLPTHLALAPGESSTITIEARTRKSDWGLLAGEVCIAPTGGEPAVARIRVKLPEPRLEAARVDYGEILPDRPTFETVLLRNTGKVRVNCSLACDQPWLAVSPSRVNIPIGGEKYVKLRAMVPSEQAGSKQAALLVTTGEKVVLSVPISLQCRVPKPVLAPIRKQTLGAIANDVAVVRRFRVANAGEGRLCCSVSSNQSWIEVVNRECEVAAGKKRRIEYLVRTPLMQPGLNQAIIQIRSNGGDADIPVSVNVVLPKPELHLLGDLNLGTVAPDRTAEGQLSLRNSGVGMLTVRAIPDDSHLTVSPAELTIAPGPPIKLNVAVAVEGLEGGEHSFGVAFQTNGGKGRVKVLLRLPIEKIDAPSTIDLGDRLAGSPETYALALKNAGPDTVSLLIRPTVSWLLAEVESVNIEPGETSSIPVRLLIRPGLHGPVNGSIVLEGRKIQHSIAIAAVARWVELIAVPEVVDLGAMRPKEEKDFTVTVTNRGDWQAKIADGHQAGDLEVWFERKTILPGTTESLLVRGRMNARISGNRIEAEVPLGHEAILRLVARVYSSRKRYVAVAVGLACVLSLLLIGWFDLRGLVAVVGIMVLLSLYLLLARVLRKSD